MFARLLALCCLSISVLSPGWAASTRPATAKLAVYFKTQASPFVRPLDSMKRELARLMLTAGYTLEWRGPQDSPIDTGAFLAVVELRGDCEAVSGRPASANTVELASTAVSDGRVLPFSWVNCGNLAQLLSPALADLPRARADFIFGRAIARLLAHEFYHILMQTREHTGNGLSKPCFTASELLAERFEFEHGVLAELQVCPAGRTPDGSISLPGPVPGASLTGAGAEPPDALSGRAGTDRQRI
jgi:hypothetical protein